MSKQANLQEVVNNYLNSRNLNHYNTLVQKFKEIGGNRIEQYKGLKTIRNEAEEVVNDLKRKRVIKDHSDLIRLYSGLIAKIDEEIDALRGGSLIVIPQKFSLGSIIHRS